MYAWIWRILPFGRLGKSLSALVLVLGAGALLWYVVFPWAEPLLPFDDVQVTQNGGDPNSVGGTTDGGGVGNPGVDEELPYPSDSNNPKPTPSR